MMDAALELVLHQVKAQVHRCVDLATPEAHQTFFTQCGISNDLRKSFMVDAIFNTEAMVKSNRTARHTVPKTLHRMWLTNPDDPAMPPDAYVSRIKRQLTRLGSPYRYYFWHNCDEVAQALFNQFKSIQTEVQFIDVSELSYKQALKNSVAKAIAAKKFVLAGDITKFMILREFGGYYADVGVDFDEPLLHLARQCDLTLFLDRNMIFQPAFMGAVPKHALLQTWEHLLAEPEILSAICLPDLHQFRGGHEIWLHGGVAFTAIAILFAREGESLFPVPPNLGSLHHESQGSWYLPGSKFGNATKDSAVTNLDAEKHVTNVKANAKFQETLCGWSDAGKARALINCHLNSVHWLSSNRVT